MKTTNPPTVGLSMRRLQRIDQYIEQQINMEQLPGIVTLVARRGQVAHLKAFGWQDLFEETPMHLDTIFRIYSMTKPVTTVAALMLFEEGQFQLNEPVSAYLPAFLNTRVFERSGFSGMETTRQNPEMTILNLLTHTAGFGYGLLEDSPIEAMYREAQLRNPNLSLAERINKLAEFPLLYQPGTAWRYSVATDVLGRLVEVVSGMSLDKFFAERVFQPLEMHDTGYFVPTDKFDRLATMYGPAPVEQEEEVSEKLFKRRGLSNLIFRDEEEMVEIDTPATSEFIQADRGLWGGTGLVSTAGDYLRFCQMLLNQGAYKKERLLSRKTVELMTQNHLHPSLIPYQIGPKVLHGYGFGLGVRVMQNVAQTMTLGSVGEFGWSGAGGTYFWIDPREEMIGIFMSQFMPTSLRTASRVFQTLAYQAIVD